MKTVILITVIESLVVMLAITYFYYRRSQSEKRALLLRGPHVSIAERAKAKLALFSNAKLKMNSTHCRSEEQTAKPGPKIKK